MANSPTPSLLPKHRLLFGLRLAYRVSVWFTELVLRFARRTWVATGVLALAISLGFHLESRITDNKLSDRDIVLCERANDIRIESNRRLYIVKDAQNHVQFTSDKAKKRFHDRLNRLTPLSLDNCHETDK